MANLKNWAISQGYTPEQADVIDRLDDIFTEAINVGLLDGDYVEDLGRRVGRAMQLHQAKLNS